MDETRNDNPRLRSDLEIVQAKAGDRDVLVIRDRIGLIEGPVAVTLDAVPLLRLLDGSRSLRDIQAAWMRSHENDFSAAEQVAHTIAQLDEAFVLDSDTYRKARQAAIDAYATETVRGPFAPGLAYPGEKEQLAARLDDILAIRPSAPIPAGRELQAIVAPHIELAVGAEAYSSVYTLLRNRPIKRVIILGTGHSIDRGPYCLTDKSFETPLGITHTDKEAVAALRAAGGEALVDNDMVHKQEHSIEFQIVFLQHVLGASAFNIVPILCGSMMPWLAQNPSAGAVPELQPFLHMLRDLLADDSESTLLVAGVDFSHIGPKFGHDRTAKDIEPESREHDAALLRALSQQDKEAFWAESQRVEDRYNVCGFSVMATMLEVLQAGEGEQLHYDVWHEAATQSAVSFAAAAFTR